MERSIIFDKHNSWYDWHSILTAKELTPPEAKTHYVALDGMSGTLDLSEALGGEVHYNDRTLVSSFWTDEGNREERERLRQRITLALHGKKVHIIEPDDPEHYLLGRVSLTSFENILPYATYTLEAICDPWRYAIEETRRLVLVSDSDAVDVVINNHGVKTLVPDLIIKGTVKLNYGDLDTVTLADGEYRVSDLKLHQGVNVIGVSGTGSVTFVYREAEL